MGRYASRIWIKRQAVPERDRHKPIVVLMGVTGAGKTTVGRRLAHALGWPFLEGDDLHPPGNVEKMRRGVPLTDADRVPWFERLRENIERYLDRNQPAVVASSALREAYRVRLRPDPEAVRLVYLKGSRKLLCDRLEARAGHFMKSSLLESQLALLEEPADALVIDAALPVDEIVARIRAAFGI